MISQQLNCIFVHIPKCVGTSIEVALHPYADESFGHSWAIKNRAYRNQELFTLIDKHTDYYLSTVVRNPYDRIVSSWNHFRTRERCSLSDYIRKAEALLQSGFATLYRQLRDNRTGNSYLPEHSDSQTHAERFYPFRNNDTGYHVLPMSYFVPRRNFDYVGRCEQIEADWTIITHALGRHIPLRHLNRRESHDYRDLLTPDDFDRINRIYADDFSRFRYQREQF